MPRTLKKPSGSPMTGLFGFDRGGHGQTNAKDALQVLDGIPRSTVDAPNGPFSLDENGKLSQKVRNALFRPNVALDKGQVTLQAGQSEEWFLSSYDKYSEYVLQANLGTVRRDHNVITFTAGAVSGLGGFTVNGKQVTVVVDGDIVNTPSITSPTNGALDCPSNQTLTASAYSNSNSSDAHASTDWQLALDPNFLSLYRFDANSSDKTSWQPGTLQENTTFYARVRYRAASGKVSNWSNVVQFKTVVDTTKTTLITSPVSGTANLMASQLFTASGYTEERYNVVTKKLDESGAIVDTVQAEAYTEHIGCEFQLSRVSNFSTIDQNYTSGEDSFNWLAGGLLEATTYYLRARNKYRIHEPSSVMANGTVNYQTTDVTMNWSPTAAYATAASFGPAKPSILSPLNNSTNKGSSPSFQSSIFSSLTGKTHASTDWQISLNETFVTTVQNVTADTVNKTTWTASGLLPSNTYYARCRYRDNTGGLSEWSPVIKFTTAASFAPATPTAPTWYEGTPLGIKSIILKAPLFSSPVADDAFIEAQFSMTDTVWTQYFTTTVNGGEVNTRVWPVNVSTGQTFYAYVRLRGKFGWSEWSARLTITIAGVDVENGH